ncbi:YqeG family HAD IIIA-type phosphatase [Dethiothermospora halolimnae]|uniref:YqeG family HAD IIIA-type phosphatase n=1 Tax=Dethiothermospora halolimnae TaxID=3114390 RepID=UPI003CCC1A6B
MLIPDLYVDSIFQIDFDNLKEKGIKSLIIDIDNTLVAWDKESAPDSVIKWFDKIKKMGFNICLVSNNTEDRVVKFNENLSLYAVHRATKPRKKPFLDALSYLKTTVKETAMIGDQIFTDVLGGNRVGLYTILVVPIAGKEFIWTKFIRNIERLVLKKINKGENKKNK